MPEIVRPVWEITFGGAKMKADERTGIRRGTKVAGRPEQGGPSMRATTADDALEEVLPESYRSCLDAIPDLMALKGEELEYLFVNKAYCELLNRRQDELLGRRALDVFPRDIARQLETMDLLVLASLDKSVEEVRIGDRIFEIRKFPVSLHDRGLVVVSGRDITERKESEAALLTEKIRFQIISDNAPLGMLLLDGQGTVKYVNTKFRDIFGYDLDDLPDGTTWFRRVFPDREFEVEVLSVLSRPGEVSGWREKERHVLTAICRDGTQRIVSIEAVQLASGDVVVSCDDVAGHMTDKNGAAFKADYDTLTGLPNKSSLHRAAKNVVDHAREGKKRRSVSAILFVAIHDFPKLRGAYDAASVDEILGTFATLLNNILRAGDTAYRSGGDQFGVVFKGISLAEARLAAERIYNALTTYTFLSGRGDVRLDLAICLVQVDGTEDEGQILAIGEKMIKTALATGQDQIVVHKPAGD
jgi:diguanylate cyclase (GGDEF)-like protein/PAS domain S-box-containing protein